MRALRVISRLDLRNGGPSHSVLRVSAALRRIGADARILTVREASMLQDPFIGVYAHNSASVPLLRALTHLVFIDESVRYRATGGV